MYLPNGTPACEPRSAEAAAAVGTLYERVFAHLDARRRHVRTPADDAVGGDEERWREHDRQPLFLVPSPKLHLGPAVAAVYITRNAILNGSRHGWKWLVRSPMGG